MRTVTVALLLGWMQMTAAGAQATNPFLGRWDITLSQAFDGQFNSCWLGVSEKQGKLEVLFQSTEGHATPVESFNINQQHMSVVVAKESPRDSATTLELDVADRKISGVLKHENQTISMVGVPAPEMKRSAPAAWTDPQPLFNGKNLDGWEAVRSAGDLHWTVQNGELINEQHGGNIKTTRKFDDFKLHFQVRCPERSNSGFFLRGRYEVQLAGGPGSPPSPAPPPTAARRGGGEGGRGFAMAPNRAMGAVYGRIAPSQVLTTPPAGWDTFDITLVGRTVTIVRNGVTIIDQKEIEGTTGGALDSNEGEPGPLYIQGDHSGNVRFRNVTVSVPKR